MAIDATYAKHIRDQTGRFATWLPNARVAIGDYGTVSGALFEKLASLDGVKASTAPAKASFDFNINADRSINANAKALADVGATPGSALLEFTFHKEAAVSLSAPDSVVTRVDDLLELGLRLLSLGGQWKRRDYYVVFEVVTAPRATILVSQSSGAEMKFEVAADTQINPQVVANLDSKASLRMSKGVSTKIVGEGPLTPLYRLAYLKSRLLHDPQIRAYRRHDEGKPEQVDITGTDYLELY